uniref:TPT domain-containing protein n=1 Tax=Ascaris lumbricoides TaxID=6252 RepID=A0A0M3HQE1_ASCLU
MQFVDGIGEMLNDTIFYFLLNLSSSFCLAAAHNALFFVLDMRTVVMHFLHYALTFCFLLLCYALGMKQTRACLPIQPFVKPVLTQILIVLLSSTIHSQQRSGSLYLLRLFDCVTMFTVIHYGKKILATVSTWPSYGILLPIAIGGSLSWLEFSIIEYDTIALLLCPLLAVAQGLTAVGLSIPALRSWLNSHVSANASWESIDYVLIGMSIVFMPNFKYSELWLQLHLDARDFLVLEQSKFWAASIGQWFLQNMAHATIFSLVGKILLLGGLVRYAGYLQSRRYHISEAKR